MNKKAIRSETNWDEATREENRNMLRSEGGLGNAGWFLQAAAQMGTRSWEQSLLLALYGPSLHWDNRLV